MRRKSSETSSPRSRPNGMIAPSFWVDPKTGNDYLLTVQYPEESIKTLSDLKGIPIAFRARRSIPPGWTPSRRSYPIQSPTEVDHFQLRRVIDIFVSPQGEELGRVARAVERIVQRDEDAGRRARGHPRLRAGDELLLHVFRPGPDPRPRPRLSHPRRAVQIVHRSLPHPAGGAAGHRRRDGHARRSPARR